MFIWGSSSSCSKLGLHYAPVGTQAKATAKVAAGSHFFTKIRQYRVDYFSRFCEKLYFFV